MNKLVIKREDVRGKILSGLATIADPVVATLSPRGSNCIIESDEGNHILTNDGVTIAKSISSKDSIENTVIEVIKGAALRTNTEAGDGTTTTILLSSVLVREAIKLLDAGFSWIDIRNELNKFGEDILKEVEKMKVIVKNDVGLKDIATTSSNNDPDVAKYVLEAVKVAREEGLIFLEGSNRSGHTEVVKDLGFMVKSGVPYQELFQKNGGNQVRYKNPAVLLTDKKLYYSEEAETILRVAVEAGQKAVVVVAKDFMGEALNVFIANHAQGVIDVMLVKDPNPDDKSNPTIYDLATYIGAKVITEKTGSLVNKLNVKDFTVVNQVFSDPVKTLFTPKVAGSKELKDLVAFLRKELDKDQDNTTLKTRLASLTTGVVTIKVGGHTEMEIREKVFRYEDAVNACRAAMRFGYLAGGGTSLLRAFKGIQRHPSDYIPMYKRYCEAILRQIATNCGKHQETVLERVKGMSGNFGYNALTDKYEDLLKAGVADPFQVIKMAVLNSISVTNIIISVNHYVLNDVEEYDEEAKS